MKSYIVSTPAGPVEVFYDPHIRLWTAYLIGGDGYQAAHAAYGISKVEAIRAATIERRYA